MFMLMMALLSNLFQTPVQTTFEVVSIKENTANTTGPFGGMEYLPGGRFSAKNMPLMLVIASAYGVGFQSGQISFEGPDLDGSVFGTRWDIEAVAADGAIPIGTKANFRKQIMQGMLKTLLAERFKLMARHESREQPAYALTVPKNGPKLEKAKEEACADIRSPSTNVLPCHHLGGGQGLGIRAQAVDMADLAVFLSNFTDRPVVDGTGLSGLYNITTVGWVPLRPRPGAPATAPGDPKPTLFSVLDELGLKLETQRAPIEMLVVTSIHRPSEN
jgi:uncharacterized protein (TIGR03435 family)